MSRTNHPRSTGFEDLSGLGGFDSHLAESGPRSICVLSLPIYLKDDMSAFVRGSDCGLSTESLYCCSRRSITGHFLAFSAFIKKAGPYTAERILLLHLLLLPVTIFKGS